MENILVYRKEASLRLTFIDAFHPSEVNIKADNWYFRYKLYGDDFYEFAGWFTGKFWYLDGEEIIAFEEYVNENFDKDTIKYNEDVELRIFIIDFKKNATANFSKLRNGTFEIIELKEDRIIYLKKQYDKIGEFEINIDSLKFDPIK